MNACGGNPVLSGFTLLIVGLFLLIVGLRSRGHSTSGTLSSDASPGSTDLKASLEGAYTLSRRFAVIFVGGLLALLGVSFVFLKFGCGFHTPDLGAIAKDTSFTDWPPFLELGVVLGGVCGYYWGRTMSPPYRALLIIGVMLLSFAFSEAAAFHEGSQATRWIVIGLILMIPAAFVQYFGERSARPKGKA